MCSKTRLIVGDLSKEYLEIYEIRYRKSPVFVAKKAEMKMFRIIYE